MVQSLDVSIPFIAGQWSLPSRREARFRDRRMFQSPSLRGSGRFTLFAIEGCTSLIGFNPLHCGAVVASLRPVQRRAGAGGVSIPFIAGQWSLLPGRRPPATSMRSCLNPLHCGAVVASRGKEESMKGTGFRLNPLHCGAVVASSRARRSRRARKGSQSPSLRGSGRFIS